MSKKSTIEKSVQKEVLLKRLLFQIAFDQLDVASVNAEQNVTLDIPPAILNRLLWEHVIVHADQLNDEWDHVIAGFDDPKFDWEHAAPPKMNDPSAQRQKYIKLVEEVADRLEDHLFGEVFETEISNNLHDVALLQHLLVEMFECRNSIADEFISAVADLGLDECSCFENKLYGILEGSAQSP